MKLADHVEAGVAQHSDEIGVMREHDDLGAAINELPNRLDHLRSAVDVEAADWVINDDGGFCNPSVVVETGKKEAKPK